MPLKLTIISYQRLSPGQETTKVLDRGSISIGRAAQNDWILQDPERILSGKHCTVHHQDGDYFLTDTSTNGVYLNDSEQRMERLKTVRLRDGDRFVLGEYEISAAVSPTAAEEEVDQEGPITDVVAVPSTTTRAADTALPDIGIVSLGGGDAGNEAVPAPPAKPSFSDVFAEEEGHDGLDILSQPSSAKAVATEPPPDLTPPDRAFFEPPALVAETPVSLPEPMPEAPPQEQGESIASELDLPEISAPPIIDDVEDAESEAAALPNQVAEASSASIIPEDWWMAPPAPAAQPMAKPSPTPKQPPILAEAFSAAPQTATSQPPALPPTKATAQPALQPKPVVSFEKPSLPVATERPAGPDGKALLRAFLEGAGLPNARLSDEQLPEIMNNLGAIFRATVQGMMEILLARGDVKGEFRLDRTNIGPMENNPLKTPPGQPPLSPEEVMTLLLIRRKDAYMSPVQAVREGFNDIKAHQLAVMAGIQAALNRLLERFAPSSLETRLQQTVLDSILPANRKAKYWDLFTAEYRAIAHEAEEDFNELFGDEFARAYQERLHARR